MRTSKGVKGYGRKVARVCFRRGGAQAGLSRSGGGRAASLSKPSVPRSETRCSRFLRGGLSAGAALVTRPNCRSGAEVCCGRLSKTIFLAGCEVSLVSRLGRLVPLRCASGSSAEIVKPCGRPKGALRTARGGRCEARLSG